MTVAARASKVKENVLRILEENAETRNDDRLLMLIYWEQVDQLNFDLTFPLLFGSRGTSPESISRARRQIQEAGLWMPTTEEARTRRRMAAAETRAHYAQARQA